MHKLLKNFFNSYCRLFLTTETYTCVSCLRLAQELGLFCLTRPDSYKWGIKTVVPAHPFYDYRSTCQSQQISLLFPFSDLESRFSFHFSLNEAEAKPNSRVWKEHRPTKQLRPQFPSFTKQLKSQYPLIEKGITREWVSVSSAKQRIITIFESAIMIRGLTSEEEEMSEHRCSPTATLTFNGRVRTNIKPDCSNKCGSKQLLELKIVGCYNYWCHYVVESLFNWCFLFVCGGN